MPGRGGCSSDQPFAQYRRTPRIEPEREGGHYLHIIHVRTVPVLQPDVLADLVIVQRIAFDDCLDTCVYCSGSRAEQLGKLHCRHPYLAPRQGYAVLADCDSIPFHRTFVFRWFDK